MTDSPRQVSAVSLVALEIQADDGDKPTEDTPLLIRGAEAGQKYSSMAATIPDVVHLALPVTASTLLTYIIPSISLMFCGHLGDDRYIASAGLSSALANVTGAAVTQGLLTALDSLASQAYGCRNYKRFCVLYQRSLIVLLAASLPVRLPLPHTRSILVGKCAVGDLPCARWPLSALFSISLLCQWGVGSGIRGGSAPHDTAKRGTLAVRV